MPDNLTATQFAVMAKLFELGSCSQNKLGRHVAMDAATIKGVIDRLFRRGLVNTEADLNDRRRLNVNLTQEGEALLKSVLPNALKITQKSLEPLTQDESEQLIKLLSKLA
jgi:DNA-binding MarR family transcriptional regulator